MKEKQRKKGDFRTKVYQAIRKYGLIEPGDRVLAAVSGGPDSLALLYVLHDLCVQFDYSLAAAYFNHGLREQAEEESRWVGEKAGSLGLPFFTGRAGKEIHERKSRSLQEQARWMRYRFFQLTARGEQFNKVALGHTATDQAETILLHIARGTGRAGLAGIPPKRVLLKNPEGNITVIRPLIECTREEVLRYLEEIGTDWLEDESNLKTDYLRNRIRHMVLPIIRSEINPQIEQAVTRVSGILRGEERLLDELSEKAFANCLVSASPGLVFSVDRMAALIPPVRRRVLRKAVSEVGMATRPPGFHTIEELESLLDDGRPNRRLSLPGGICAERTYGQLSLFPLEKEAEWDGRREAAVGRGFRDGYDAGRNEVTLAVSVPGEVLLPGDHSAPGSRRVCFEVIPRADLASFPDGCSEAALDNDVLARPLEVRTPRPGDRFHPLGAPGMKKLKKYFIEQRVPIGERGRIYLLVSGGEIAWVIGFRIDERFRVRDTTRSVLKVTMRDKK